jgi:hypothetical protein
MLKRFAHIILVVFMLISTVGFSITRHFCGGELVDVRLAKDIDPCCDMPDNCCHNESESFQLDEDYKTPILVDHVDHFAFVVFEIPSFILDFSNNEELITSNHLIGGPPPIKDVSQFLSTIQVFRL